MLFRAQGHHPICLLLKPAALDPTWCSALPGLGDTPTHCHMAAMGRWHRLFGTQVGHSQGFEAALALQKQLCGGGGGRTCLCPQGFPSQPQPEPQGLTPVTSRVLALWPSLCMCCSRSSSSWLCRACSFMRSPSSCCSAACRSLSLLSSIDLSGDMGSQRDVGQCQGLPGPGGRALLCIQSPPPTNPREQSSTPPHQLGHGGKPAPDIDFHFKAGKKVVRTMQRALSFAQKPEERTARRGSLAGGPHLIWRTSFCTSLRDLSSRSLSCRHSQSSDFRSLTAFCSATSSFRTLFAFSCSSFRVFCRSLAIHFSCSTLYANNSTKKD